MSSWMISTRRSIRGKEYMIRRRSSGCRAGCVKSSTYGQANASATEYCGSLSLRRTLSRDHRRRLTTMCMTRDTDRSAEFLTRSQTSEGICGSRLREQALSIRTTDRTCISAIPTLLTCMNDLYHPRHRLSRSTILYRRILRNLSLHPREARLYSPVPPYTTIRRSLCRSARHRG